MHFHAGGQRKRRNVLSLSTEDASQDQVDQVDPARERVAVCSPLGETEEDGAYWKYELKIPGRCYSKLLTIG